MINKVQLTNEILDNLIIEEIIYAEYASGGAMGNTGGLFMIELSRGEISQYETNLILNSALYKKACNLISERCYNFPIIGNYVGPDVFDYNDGGFGNSAFLNIHYLIGRTDDSLLFQKGSKQYEVWCSVQGVFDSVIRSIEQRYERKFNPDNFINLKTLNDEGGRLLK